ncbi:MAG: PTS fructose transporter subunit IIA [Pseudomonadota bacterium]
MSVNVIIITHEQVGPALLRTVEQTFGGLPLPTVCVPIKSSCDPQAIVAKVTKLIKQINPREGLLILTDLFGSTPTNIATRLQHQVEVKIVSGINLPMLIRVMNYPKLSLQELAFKAMSGGRDGVLDCCAQAAG